MPSYVLAAQEIAPTTKKSTTITNAIKTDSSRTSITAHHYNSNTNQAISPQRNLSLNLSPQYVDVQQQQQQQQHRKQSKHQLGQKATRSISRELKAPLIKSTVAANLPTTKTTSTNTDAKYTTTRKMFANVSNNLVGAISSDDAYSERALLLRGAENVAGSGVTQQLFNTNSSTTSAAAPKNTTTTTTTTIHDNNNQNQNSLNIRTKPTTITKIAYNNNNVRNNYGSTLIARNIVDADSGGDGAGGIDEADFLQTTDDDILSDVATTADTETVAVFINDNDEQKNSQFQMRQNITPISTTTTSSSTNANKKTKMSKLGSKNVGLKR